MNNEGAAALSDVTLLHISVANVHNGCMYWGYRLQRQLPSFVFANYRRRLLQAGTRWYD